MAGTMPHAIFVETGLDGGATVAAYAAELPGCAVFASTDVEATAGMPRRVEWFTAWLRGAGARAPDFVGDNWYEVERAAATPGADGIGRAAFSLDELPPSVAEFTAFLTWLELAREELATALDTVADGTPPLPDALEALARQDLALSAILGGSVTVAGDDPIDRLYAAREAFTAALEAAGPGADSVRRLIRLAIADDLRLAGRLRGT
jgi:hypothetical protein